MGFEQVERPGLVAKRIASRRRALQGLAAIIAGAAGLGAITEDISGKSRSRNRKRAQKRKRNAKKQCDFKGRTCPAAPNNCQQVTCEGHTCVPSALADGTACGGGRTCSNGTCLCPAGKTCEVQTGASNLNSWFGYNDETDKVDNSLISFVPGPGNPPYGNGSAQITVSGTQRRNLATYQFAGTALADIKQMKFTTYNASATNLGGPERSAFLHFNVDFNGSDTWQRRLVYVPDTNGTVVPDVWQEWDAISNGAARWVLSGGTWPTSGDPASTVKTWDDILAAYPNVRIRVTDAFLGMRVGEPYGDGFVGNIGSFTFTTVVSSTRFVFGPDS